MQENIVGSQRKPAYSLKLTFEIFEFKSLKGSEKSVSQKSIHFIISKYL